MPVESGIQALIINTCEGHASMTDIYDSTEGVRRATLLSNPEWATLLAESRDMRLTHGLQDEHLSLPNFLTGRRGAVWIGLCAMALLTFSNFALAAFPAITSVTFTGANVDLHVVISGTGFGSAPPGVPCTKCGAPYLKVVDGRGDLCQLFNVISWRDGQVVFSGLLGAPGDPVLVFLTNPQNNLLTISSTVHIPNTITLASPIIKSVSFSGSIGRSLQMTIAGSGFGTSPPNLPFVGNLPFFAFVDRPFEATEWVAGYTQGIFRDSVTLKFGFWSPTKIKILGFGGSYGQHGFKISPGDPVEIFVANTDTCGLSMNLFNMGPATIAALRGGFLP
jgi:hypothetical protein